MFNVRATFLTFSLLLTLHFAVSSSAQSAQLKSDWNSFQKDPSAFMATPPVKTATGPQKQLKSRFSQQEIRSRAFVERKVLERKANFKRLNDSATNGSRSNFDNRHPQSTVSAFAFLEMNEFSNRHLMPVTTLQEIDNANLRNGAIETQPWSGSYWPLYQGGLAARYASEDFNRASTTWKSSYDFIQKAGGLAPVLTRADAEEIDELSPAEKYDLLIGLAPQESEDALGNLTSAMWLEGSAYRARNGTVEPWMGYCHGWAPASLMDARPVRRVEAPGADSKLKLQFYPSDLKALSTLLWAKGDFQNSFIGGRCNEKSPKTDPDSGRLLNKDCFDVDPGIWHLIVVNQVGLLRRGLVIDATYDYQVWNQPLFNYKITYFNPQTGRATEKLKTAAVELQKFSKDKFKKFRNADTVSVVGAEMTIQYATETEPSHKVTDSLKDDGVQTVSYIYDLELNAAGEIIGGEWYQNAHPDFLWMPQTGQRPSTSGDSEVPGRNSWTPAQPLPVFWRDIARKSAASHGEPVAKIVEALLLDSSAN